MRTQCVLLGDLDGIAPLLGRARRGEWVQGMQALRFEDSGGRPWPP
jgi:hypothetical protein